MPPKSPGWQMPEQRNKMRKSPYRRSVQQSGILLGIGRQGFCIKRLTVPVTSGYRELRPVPSSGIRMAGKSIPGPDLGKGLYLALENPVLWASGS